MLTKSTPGMLLAADAARVSSAASRVERWGPGLSAAMGLLDPANVETAARPRLPGDSSDGDTCRDSGGTLLGTSNVPSKLHAGPMPWHTAWGEGPLRPFAVGTPTTGCRSEVRHLLARESRRAATNSSAPGSAGGIGPVPADRAAFPEMRTALDLCTRAACRSPKAL